MLGYGFRLGSSAESSFDMRAGAADRLVVTNRFPTLRFGNEFLVASMLMPNAATRNVYLPAGWHYDAQTGFIEIRSARSDGTSTIQY